MYQTLLHLLQPFPLCVVGLGLSLAVASWRSPDLRRRLRWAWLFYALLLVDCLPITAYFIAGALEWQYPRRMSRPEETKVIVVLGGGVYGAIGPDDVDRLSDSSIYRAQRAAELYRTGPSCTVIVSGGHADPTLNIASPATLMAEFLTRSGVDPADLIIEAESRNTAENAEFTAKVLRQHGWKDGVVLVTSAVHIPRSMLLFRRQGYDAIPVACSYRTQECEQGVFAFWPQSSAASANQEVVHEVLGMAWLWLRGKI